MGNVETAGSKKVARLRSRRGKRSQSPWTSLSHRVPQSRGSQGEDLSNGESDGHFLPGLAQVRNNGARAPIGKDDRRKITETHLRPFTWISHLVITPPQPKKPGSRFKGTGWLIGPRTIITAGHCVFNGSWSGHGSGWAGGIEVHAGRNGPGQTVRRARAVRMFSVREWLGSGDPRFDFGAIVLDKPIGTELGYFGFRTIAASAGQINLNIVGYPAVVHGKRNDGFLYGHRDQLVRATRNQLEYRVDTSGGQSGAPVIWWDGDASYDVVGIHNRGSGAINRATRITDQVFNILRQWKRAGR